jgi:ABC-type phosphate transport system substrate-binding protein
MSNHSVTVGCLVLVSALAAATPINAGEIVVVMSPGGSALTKEQVAKLYLGRSNDLKPLDLPPTSTTREAFYRKATGRDAAEIKAVWSRITFTGQGLPPKEVADAVAVKKAVAADPKAVGYIEKSDVDASVSVVLSLD